MTFSTHQVAAAAQVTLRQLQWWTERGIIPVGIEKHERKWDEGKLFKALLVARLRSKGLSLQRVRQLLIALPLNKISEQPEAVLLIRRKGMRICTEESLLRAMDLENGPVWVICVSSLLEVLKRESRKVPN